MIQNKKIGHNFNWDRLFFIIKLFIFQPFLEVYYGLETKKIPLVACLYFTFAFQIFVIFHIDLWMFKIIGIADFYPTGEMLRIYQVMGSISSFYFWGALRAVLQLKLVRRLTQVFTDLKLKSITGRMPSFIFDVPIDSYTRTMRLRRNGFTKAQFQAVSDQLDSDLQIFIDEITEDRTKGTIDILYSQRSLTKMYKFPDISGFSKRKFLIGQSRAKTLSYSLENYPHLLVAGQTGGGKSTFLRQFITSLFIKNKKYTFDLIDLKNSEFHLFKRLPRVKVFEDVEASIDQIKWVSEELMEDRKKLLSLNECIDLDQFIKIPLDERRYPPGLSKESNFSKHIVVIDEAIDLFLTGTSSTAQANLAKKYAARIAAQGRVVGIHLVVATQRPDRFAVDPKIKANLVGKLCYKMPNNASSMTILDSKRAKDLPKIDGRAIWSGSGEMLEVQTPFLNIEDAEALLKPFKSKRSKNVKNANQIEDAEDNSFEAKPMGISFSEVSYES